MINISMVIIIIQKSEVSVFKIFKETILIDFEIYPKIVSKTCFIRNTLFSYFSDITEMN